MRSWYLEKYQEIAEQTADIDRKDEAASNSYCIAPHSLMCDATSSAAWKNTYKLHSMQVTSIFVTKAVREDDSWLDMQQAVDKRSQLADLQLCGAGTGPHGRPLGPQKC